MVFDFIVWYSYHTYFSPIWTSWYRRFGTRCIVRNDEWCIFVNYCVFSALCPLKLRVVFEVGILGTSEQKDAVLPIVISNFHRWKPNSTKTDSLKYCLKHHSSRLSTIPNADVNQIIQSNLICVHIIVQGTHGFDQYTKGGHFCAAHITFKWI